MVLGRYCTTTDMCAGPPLLQLGCFYFLVSALPSCCSPVPPGPSLISLILNNRAPWALFHCGTRLAPVPSRSHFFFKWFVEGIFFPSQQKQSRPSQKFCSCLDSTFPPVLRDWKVLWKVIENTRSLKKSVFNSPISGKGALFQEISSTQDTALAFFLPFIIPSLARPDNLWIRWLEMKDQNL